MINYLDGKKLLVDQAISPTHLVTNSSPVLVQKVSKMVTICYIHFIRFLESMVPTSIIQDPSSVESLVGLWSNSKSRFSDTNSTDRVPKAPTVFNMKFYEKCHLISGTTRDNFDGKKVVRLEYEAYEDMAKKEMYKVCRQIREKWDVKHIAIYHRIG